MDMNDDAFKALKGIETPALSPEARRRAIGASLLAFDAAQREKEFAPSSKGMSFGQRLRSIVPIFKGNWIMDASRLVPAGTAALAVLILIPLGYQLYSSTALTSYRSGNSNPAGTGPIAVDAQKPQAPDQKTIATAERAEQQVAPVQTEAAPAAAKDREAASAARSDSLGAANSGVVSSAAEPAPPVEIAPQQEAADLAAAPAPASMPSVAANVAAAPRMTERFAPSPHGPVIVNAPSPSGDTFATFTESAQKAVATDPVSTFSIDVDTASYSYVRRVLNEGRIPEPDAVRLEEMINYFPYDYPAATSASEPFKPTISVFPTPWNAKTQLMEIGIKGYEPPAAARKPSNLVFLIDTSGSMDSPDKLPLLQHALTLLVNTLSADDTVSIVAYAGSAGIVLEPTKASDKAKILTALNDLSAGGATAGAEGIELAYQLAGQHKVAGTNRVILATDGDFNVGIDDPDQLKTFIKQKRQAGIGLSVLGFGEGNLDDATMQALAQNGDGNASYIDSLSEAQKVLVKEAGSTLDAIAKDVKIQVEFNPATISSYRLIGYETRALNREDFNNDKVDAGDVGAGHTVTALYEITPVGADVPPNVDPLRYGSPEAPSAAPADGKSAELADFKLRYKLPGSTTSKLIEQPVTTATVVDDIAKASNDARWAAAVAAFGQKLKGSDYAGALSYGDIVQLAKGARGSDPDGYRSEFINLVGLAGALGGGTTPQPAAE